MKKFFLIPLLACSFCVMAFAETRTAGTFAELQSAISEAVAGDVIQLTADFSVTSSLGINKSISIDGQNHKLTGAIKDNGVFKLQGANDNQLQFALENVKIENAPTSGQNIILFLNGYIDSLAITNCDLKCTKNVNNPKVIEYRGAQTQAAKIGIHNSHLFGNNSGYAIRAYNPSKLYMDNSQLEGYGCLNFQYPRDEGGLGARGTQVFATNCNFDSPNIHSGGTNSFMVFNFADDGISVELDNCGMNAEMLGNSNQSIFGTNGWNLASRRTQDINIVIKGDNSYMNGDFMDSGFIVDYNPSGNPEIWENGFWTTCPPDAWFDAHPEVDYYNYFYSEAYNFETGYDESKSFKLQNTANINFTIKGGTYALNPDTYKYKIHVATEDPTTHMPLTWTMGGITIPEGYEVKAIETQQGDKMTTLYRVRQEITGSTALNDNAGQNENTDIKVEESVTLVNETTVAEYIEVKGNEDPEAETVTVTVPEDKTLVVGTGLDVTGNAEVVVKAGSTLIVKEGGVISESAENIVIEANETSSAAFLLDPEVVVNTTPLATYKFKSKARRLGENSYIWQRFGIPTFNGKTTMSWDNNGGALKTALYEFNYTNNGWERIHMGEGPFEVEGTPFQCYDMTINQNPEEDVVYSFTGNLMGNIDATLDFVRGWNYYANCYTAPVDLKSFIGDLMKKYGDNEAEKQIAATIYLFDRDELDSWTPITWAQLQRSSYDGPKEIKPMQAFIMQLAKGDPTVDGINYRDNVFDPLVNPTLAPAPAREAEDEFNAVDILVSNGTKNDKMTLFEKPTLSEAFDNGWDAEKFEDNGVFSLYRELDGKKWQDYGSNDLGDQFLTFETKEAGEYTMTFSGVDGQVMKLYDAVADKLIEMKEGAEYKFTAEAIKDAERFQINPKNAPSGIDEVESIAPKATKYIGQDGQLYIRRAGNVYTVQGQNVK